MMINVWGVLPGAGLPRMPYPAPLHQQHAQPRQGLQSSRRSRQIEAIMSTSIGTDPTLALQTRRGAGFYKVPSLRGIWYRTGMGHAGQAETLEEWFDPARLQSDYVPKGFHLGPGPIGHEKELDLSPEDRKALIAILKTL
jgi:hypothetical protein